MIGYRDGVEGDSRKESNPNFLNPKLAYSFPV